MLIVFITHKGDHKKSAQVMEKIMSGFPVSAATRVPLEDWDRAPWNRWSFQHVRELVPTAEVWRGEGSVWELPEMPVALDAIEFADAAGDTMSLQSWYDDAFNDGLLVIHRGHIVHESYHNGMTPRSLHLSQSVAKSVTACVAGAPGYAICSTCRAA